MKHVVVRSGREPLVEDVTEWLNGLGIPDRLIKSVTLHAEVGDVLMVTVQLYVEAVE